MKNIETMVSEFSNVKKIILIALLVLGLINAGLLIWYIFEGYQYLFHSDSAAKVLIAREIIETGQYFPSDWNYVNKDLFVLFGHTFIIPLLNYFPAGFFVHSISGMISAVLVLTGAWFITGMLELNKIQRSMIVLIFMAGISGFMAENLYGQVSYGMVFISTCYSIYFSWLFLSSTGVKRLLAGGGLIVVLVLAFWQNPLRAAVCYMLPLLSAVIYIGISLKMKGEIAGNAHRVYWYLVIVIFVSVGIGSALSQQTLLLVNNIPGAGSARWLSIEGMLRNLLLTLKGFLGIFGGIFQVDRPVTSVLGLYEMVRFCVAVALLVLMPLSMYSALKNSSSSIRFLAAFTLSSSLLVFFIQIATTVPDMSDPVQSARYLIPSLLLLFILVLSRSVNDIAKPVSSLINLGVLVVFITSAYPAYVMSSLSSVMSYGMKGQHNNQREKVNSCLIENELKYGYASYWNAGATTVLTDERVQVRQILIGGGLPVPMRHLSSNRWYRADAWKQETFLMLTDGEKQLINWDAMAQYDSVPVREFKCHQFTIYVFKDNLAKNLPGWDLEYNELKTFIPSKRTLHQVGSFQEDYQGEGAALVSGVSEVGALHYGPYIGVMPGEYEVVFRVESASAIGKSVRLDVARSPDQKILAVKDFVRLNGEVKLVFSVEKLSTVEFRVWALGGSTVVFRGVSIIRR